MKKLWAVIYILISIDGFSQVKLFPVEIKGKWGFMDGQGNMVLKPVYDYAADFTEGCAVVALHNLPCLINEKGERLIDTNVYQMIGYMSEGLSAATDFNRKKFYVNRKGEKVISLPDSVYEARPFRGGLACVAKSGEDHKIKFDVDIVTLAYKFGYINKAGSLVVPFEYDDADDFVNGRARVKKGSRFGVINTRGEYILKPEYGNIGDFYEGKAIVDVKGKYGFADTNGIIVIKPDFEYARDFNNGLAAVLVDRKFGFINAAGDLKIPATFENVKPFNEGKAAVLQDGKWGFIDQSGKWVIRNVFDNAGIFSEGLCPVLVKRKWGFIDETGRLAIPADFDAAGSFHDGVADVVFHDINLYVNRNGTALPKLGK